MNILITGAFGFIGTNLSKSLSKAHSLQALDVQEPMNHDYQSYFSWNTLDQFDWTELDAIIHLAGKAHDTKNTTENQAYFDINVGLTKRIFEYFLASKASKFIFFSSVKAVADTVSGGSLNELATPNSGTPYGRSKLAAEQYLLNQPLPEGKKVYILRPCMIHGPGNKGNLNLLYKLVSKGIPWPLGAFENKRSFTSIDNLQFVIDQIITNDIEPGIYNVADDEPISTNRLIELIAESKNKNARIWNVNQQLISLAGKLGDRIHLPLNSERLKKLTESYVVSNRQLKKALGVERMPVRTEDGMKKTLESFK